MTLRNKARAALVTTLAIAVAVGGCGPAAGVKSARFSALREDGPVTWEASEAEVDRFDKAYADATRLSNDNGTTPPARIDAVLESGESLVVWGGSADFQTVSLDGQQFNVAGEDLHRLLQEIAERGAP
jgi:hypothetical protein